MLKDILTILLTITAAVSFHHGARAESPACRDTIRASVIGDTIIVYHDGGQWNSCADIVSELVRALDTLNIHEFETFAESPCWGVCCFDVRTTVLHVPAGNYLVRVLHCGECELLGEVWVTVEIGDEGEPSLGETAQSPCLKETIRPGRSPGLKSGGT